MSLLATDIYPTVRRSLFAALAPLVDLDVDGIARAYWKRARDLTPPFLMFQPQGPGQLLQFVGGFDWSGDVLIKACAQDISGAEQLLALVPAALAAATAPAGYALSIGDALPVDLPAADGLEQAGLRVTVSLARTS